MPRKTKAARFLDELFSRALDTFEKAYEIRTAMKLLDDVDWPAELKAAVRRQEARDPEANTARTLLRHMAPELLAPDFF
jgi:hypothetical protein